MEKRETGLIRFVRFHLKTEKEEKLDRAPVPSAHADESILMGDESLPEKRIQRCLGSITLLALARKVDGVCRQVQSIRELHRVLHMHIVVDEAVDE